MKTIRNLRREADMTQAEMARVLGCTQKDVSRWERGQAQPRVDTLRQIAEIFGVSMDSIDFPRRVTMRGTLTKEGEQLTPQERRELLKAEQVRAYSKFGKFPDTYRKIAERLPSEWWDQFPPDHIAEVIDLIGEAYSEGKAETN